MPEWIIWVIIGLFAVVALVAIIAFVIKFIKMKPEERKDLLIQFLIGLVSVAEIEIVGSQKGQEKIALVEEQFKKRELWEFKGFYSLNSPYSTNVKSSYGLGNFVLQGKGKIYKPRNFCIRVSDPCESSQ